jgi:hypothetical protein
MLNETINQLHCYGMVLYQRDGMANRFTEKIHTKTRYAESFLASHGGRGNSWAVRKV